MSGVSSATLGSPLAPPLYFMCLDLKDVEVAFVNVMLSLWEDGHIGAVDQARYLKRGGVPVI